MLLSGSAVGYYGDRGDEALDETSARGRVPRRRSPGTGRRPPRRRGRRARVAHLRTGIVLAEEGGALAKMLPLFKLGLGGRFGSGRQWMSWISIEDEAAAIIHLLTSDVAGR